MTLAEFLAANQGFSLVSNPPGGATGVYGYPHQAALWSLSDYAVSSSVAGVIWLVPRIPAKSR